MKDDVDLGRTACWTAAVRARESLRADRLFDDPWADALSGDVGAEWILDRPEDATLPIVLRTRFFDDFMVSVAQQVSQIVLLGAGLDTRAYRLDWPTETVIYELDQPRVLERKDELMRREGATPSCVRISIGADLAEPWAEALLAAGFDAAQPSAWLLEGFLFYLPTAVGRQLLDGVSDLAAPGSRLGFDVVNDAVLTSPWTKAWVEMQAQLGAPWIGTLDDPEQLLGERGWVVSLTQAGAEDANHGRWKLPVIPVRAPDMPHNWYVTAEKQS